MRASRFPGFARPQRAIAACGPAPGERPASYPSRCASWVLDTHAPLSAGLLTAAGPRGHAARVATTLAVTTDDGVARAVHPATGLDAENLELFPVAVACKAADIPFAAVLGVTNMVGSTGRVDWRQFQRDAAVGAAEVFLNWAFSGASGLPASPPRIP